MKRITLVCLVLLSLTTVPCVAQVRFGAHGIWAQDVEKGIGAKLMTSALDGLADLSINASVDLYFPEDADYSEVNLALVYMPDHGESLLDRPTYQFYGGGGFSYAWGTTKDALIADDGLWLLLDTGVVFRQDQSLSPVLGLRARGFPFIGIDKMMLLGGILF